MTVQLLEEYENGKNHLPVPLLLLQLNVVFRRQPMSRITIRGVAALESRQTGWGEVSG
jgi:hypothetical protein